MNSAAKERGVEKERFWTKTIMEAAQNALSIRQFCARRRPWKASSTGGNEGWIAVAGSRR